MMKRREVVPITTAAIIAASMLAPAIAADPDINSANYLMPGCKALVALANSGRTADLAGSGVCVGTINTLRTLSVAGLLHSVCIPQHATNGQVARVVVQYIDAQPARWHENFIALAIEALDKAWPCQK
jgi:hypothetical protein